MRWPSLLFTVLTVLTVHTVSGLRPPLTARRPACHAPCARARQALALADNASPPDSGPLASLGRATLRVRDFVDKRFFLVGVVGAVALAAVAPSVGRKGGILRPELTVAWGATCGIFLLAGLSLPTNQLRAAALQWREHTIIQSFNLVAIPLAMMGVCAALSPFGIFERSVLDGMLVMAALPTTVNMCVALTRSSNGNEALAIFNAVLGNVFGVVVTPLLLLALVGRTGAISISDTLRKLAAKVLLPLLAGQLCRRAFGPTLAAAPGSKKLISRTSESLLLLTVRAWPPRAHPTHPTPPIPVPMLAQRAQRGPARSRPCPLPPPSQLQLNLAPSLHHPTPPSPKPTHAAAQVYSTFCDTFLRGFGLPPLSLAALLLLVGSTHAAFLAAAWKLGGLLRLRAADRVAVLLSSTQKTLALGLPLLNLIFAGRPDLGLLCTPLLLQHPLQLIVGSVISPKLKSYIANHPDPEPAKDA